MGHPETGGLVGSHECFYDSIQMYANLCVGEGTQFVVVCASIVISPSGAVEYDHP